MFLIGLSLQFIVFVSMMEYERLLSPFHYEPPKERKTNEVIFLTVNGSFSKKYFVEKL